MHDDAGATKELADFKAFRASLKGKPLGLLERERVARTYSNLSATLRQLQVMLSAAPAATINDNETDYDECPPTSMPSVRTLRGELKRSASRPDDGDGAQLPADGLLMLERDFLTLAHAHQEPPAAGRTADRGAPG